MSRPIKITDEILNDSVQKFIESLKQSKMFDGSIKYEQSFEWESDTEDKATVIFEPIAFVKMMSLVQNFSSEIAWHGLVKRSEENENVFIINDIVVYPQTVSGTTVEMDTEKYATWSQKLSDEDFNHLHMQGHSHVDMPTNPSTVDLKHQEDILNKLDDNMFYIFMIWNKRYESNTKVFDLKTNTLYENKDVEILIGEENLDEFVKEAKKLAVTTTYTIGKNYKSKPKTKSTQDNNKSTQHATNKKKKSTVGSEWRDMTSDAWDDYSYESGYDYENGYYGYGTR